MSHLRGRVTVLEIVFVGQCEVFICLDFIHFLFFPLAAKLIGLRSVCQFFKNFDFSFTLSLNLMSHLTGVCDGFGDNFCRRELGVCLS